MMPYNEEHDFSGQDQTRLGVEDSRATIDTWISNVGSGGTACIRPDINRFPNVSPGRGNKPMAHRTMYLPVIETTEPPAKMTTMSAKLSSTYTFCHRIMENGSVVVSENHPSTCSCSRSEPLYMGGSTYLQAWPDYAPMAPLSTHIGERQRSLNIVLEACIDTAYPFDKFNAMTYNPFRRPERRDALFYTPLAAEPILAVGAAIDFLHRRNGNLTTLAKNLASIRGMINEAVRWPDVSEQAVVDEALVLQAILCLVAASVSPASQVLTKLQ